jgi:outer membrane protein TolC
LTLKDAITIALKYHPLAVQAAAESGAAEEQVGEARSYLAPQLYGISEYLRTTDNGIGNTSYYNFSNAFPRLTGRNHDPPSGDTAKSWNTSDNYANGVGLSQYLLDFGRRRGFVEQLASKLRRPVTSSSSSIWTLSSKSRNAILLFCALGNSLGYTKTLLKENENLICVRRS